MSDFVYRFRSIDALLGDRQELDRQVVYFASLPQLNDPMEGLRDTVWQGDQILWRNLLRNYIRTLHAAHTLTFAFHDQPPELWMQGAVNVVFHLPDAPIRADIERLTADFLNQPVVRRTAEVLASRSTPIRRNELQLLLRLLHPIALKLSIEAQASRGCAPGVSAMPGWAERAAEAAAAFLEAPPRPPEVAEAVYRAGEIVSLQLNLINTTNGAGATPISRFLILEFSRRFVEALIDMIYPDCHVACFVEDPNNAAMWSAYAENQTGACLIFRTARASDDRPALTLNGFRSWRMTKGESIEERHFGPVPFSPVTYDAAYPEIPFFTSLGELTDSKIGEFWHSEDGQFTAASRSMSGENEDTWRQAYWDRYYGCVTRKTPHWAHERELRLTLQSSLEPYSTDEARSLNYRFEDLVGIVFGVRTSDADKVRIIKLIERKCREVGRTSFDFRQAVYSPLTRDIETVPLDLIQLVDLKPLADDEPASDAA
jgi:hypothetical protein